MTNDAKLGLLVGITGVVVAAVLHRPAPDAPAPPAVVTAQPPRGAVPPPRPASARPELVAQPVSRTSDDD